MKKIFKIISIVLIALILLIILIPIVFKGKIKDLVIKEANKSLNATMGVGKVSISMLKSFPSVYIGLNDLVITGQGDFDGDTLLSIRSLGVSTSLMDLIGGSPYEIKKISIDRADVRLKILADGQENWDIIKPSESGVQGNETKEAFVLKLKSLVISDSRLFYDDVPGATFAKLEGMNHSLSGDLGADFTTLKTRTTITKTYVRYEGIVYLRDALLNWDADLDADLVKYFYTFRDNKLMINDFPIIFAGSVGVPENGYDLDLAFSTPENNFKKLLSLVPAVYTRDFSEVKTDGTIGFDGFVKGKYIDEQYPAFLVNLNVKDAWFQYPDLPAAVNAINITAKIENPGGSLDNTIIDISRMTLDLAGNPVRIKLYLKNPITDPFIDTRIEGDMNLSQVKNFYPMEAGEELGGRISADITLKGKLSDLENERFNAFQAAGTIKASEVVYSASSIAQPLRVEKAEIAITPAYLELAEVKIKSGRSDFNLKGQVENYLAYYLKGETLLGNFDLRSSLIDVNELLASSGTETDTEITDTSAISVFIVPEGLDLSLNVIASRVIYQNYDMSNLKGLIRIRDEKLTLDNLSMNGLGGSLQMSGSYETKDPANPLMDFKLGINAINISETFNNFAIVKKFAPITEKVIGKLSGNIKLAGILDGHMMPRLETMAGNGDINTTEMTVSNVNTLNQLASSLKMDQLKELRIAGAKVIVEFVEGVMEVKPFDFKALGIDMNLGGMTAIDQRIGYDLKMKIPRSMMGGAANNVLNDLVDKAGKAGANIQLGDYINVDALIDGTITDPKVRLNLAGTGQDIVQSVKDQVEQKVEEIKEDVKEEADKYIQEADRQAQAILDQAQKQADEVLKSAQGLADEAKKQATASADNIIKEANGNGYVAELAAKKTAEEIVKQGDKQAENILTEAQKQSNSIIDKARQEAEKIKAEARAKAGI
jgi:cell division septum initiation protein DivIVA